VPCVTLRHTTERPETVYVGANVLAGLLPESIFIKTKGMLEKSRDWFNPLGDGKASERIIKILKEDFG
jgi:UDP-N-acetylglucosamine 2-epimerase (non-hydrolysing)